MLHGRSLNRGLPTRRPVVSIVALFVCLGGVAAATTEKTSVPALGVPPPAGSLFLYFERIPLPDGKLTKADCGILFVPVNRAEMYAEARQALPIGWALDQLGKATTDGAEARQFQPLGG